MKEKLYLMMCADACPGDRWGKENLLAIRSCFLSCSCCVNYGGYTLLFCIWFHYSLSIETGGHILLLSGKSCYY